MKTLTIASGEGEKSRSFRAELVSYVTADALWFGGQTDTETVRPVWALFAGSDEEMRPFLANLRGGRKAESFDTSGYKTKVESRYELLRSADYAFAAFRTPAGTGVTAYLRALCQADPGMVDPGGARFVLLPTAEWIAASVPPPRTSVLAAKLARQYDRDDDDDDTESEYTRKRRAETAAAIEGLAPIAPLFAAYLGRRTRCPIVSDAHFHLQLLVASLHAGHASLSAGRGTSRDFGCRPELGFVEHGTGRAKLSPGLAYQAKHADIEALLAAQTAAFFARRAS